MAQPVSVNAASAQLPAAIELLQRRAIVPDHDGFTNRQLARELNRRGWRWDLNGENASATKAHLPPGVVAQTLTVRGPDQLTNLIVLLADVIRNDEDRGLTLSQPYCADIVVRAQNGRVRILVEVKNPQVFTSESATAFRRDLLADDRLDLTVPFFLIVSQDMGFLWNNNPDPFAEPILQFPLEHVAAHYWPWFDPAERLSELALEHVMTSWLDDLALRSPDRPIEADRYFDGTNFLVAITAATVDTGAPV